MFFMISGFSGDPLLRAAPHFAFACCVHKRVYVWWLECRYRHSSCTCHRNVPQGKSFKVADAMSISVDFMWTSYLFKAVVVWSRRRKRELKLMNHTFLSVFWCSGDATNAVFSESIFHLEALRHSIGNSGVRSQRIKRSEERRVLRTPSRFCLSKSSAPSINVCFFLH